MLRLFPERVTAVLDRGGAELSRRGAPARRVLAGAGAQSGDWRSALAALEEGVAQAGLRNATLAVTLRCDLLRLQLLSWDEAVESRAEFETYARIGFEEVYGPQAREWAVVAASAPRGAPRLAAAIEQAFLDGLRSLALKYHLRLSSVQPSLARICQQRRRVLPASFLLLLAEAGRACTVLVRNRRWQSVRCEVADDSDQGLQGVLERACLLLDLEAAEIPPIFACTPQRESFAAVPVLGRTPQPLAGV